MNRRLYKISIVVIAILLGFILFYPSINAANAASKGLVPCGHFSSIGADGKPVPLPGYTAAEARKCQPCDFFALVSNVFNFIVVYGVPALATLFFLIAGFMILLGGGFPSQIAHGKSIFRTTVIGLIVIYSAWMITNTVLKSIAGNSIFTKDWNKVVCINPPQGQPTPTGSTAGKYTCNDNGLCVKALNGEFKDSSCNDECVSEQNYECDIQDQCVVSATGQYASSDCNGDCKPTDVPKKYTCSDNECIENPDGEYNTPACGDPSQCQPAASRYSCDANNQCIENPEGSYTNANCDNECQSGNPGEITFKTASLPEGAVNKEYSQALEISGGTAAYTFSISGGALPDGLDISSEGVISGIPAKEGTYTFTVYVADSTQPDSLSVTQDFTIKIVSEAASVTISDVTVDSVTETEAVVSWATDKPATSLVEYGKTTSYGSTIPMDNNETADHLVDLSGLTPGTTYNFKVKSSIAGFNAVSSNYVFKTNSVSNLAITTTSLESAVIGDGFTDFLSAEGGKEPYKWSKISGNLPDGLVLDSDGNIDGKPTKVGDFAFTVKVEDSFSPPQFTTKNLSMKIEANAATACMFSELNLCQGNSSSGCANSGCGQYAAAINKQATGVATANVLKAFMEIESSCNISVASGTSYGLMQLSPATANKYKMYCGVTATMNQAWLTNPANAENSICIAAAYINAIAQSQCGSSVRNIYAGYNGGEAGPNSGCASSASCAGETDCAGEPVRKWECLYDNKQHTVCNGDSNINLGFNQTKQGATKVIYCASNPGF